MRTQSASGTSIFALRRFVEPARDRCELCHAALPGAHAHLIDIAQSSLRCICERCLRSANREDLPFKLVRPRREKLCDFRMSDAEWNALQIPIRLAFLMRSDGKVKILYPSAAGLVHAEGDESLWEALERSNPGVRELEPEVEALAIDRVRGKRDAYRLSIDHCYALAGLIRSEWQGFAGGPGVWEAIDAYFREDEPDVAGRTHSHA